MTPLVTEPVWIDLTAADPAAESAFYGSIFGWTYPPQHPDAGGWLAAMTPHGYAGGISPRWQGMDMSYWTVFFGTPDIEAALARATQLGAKVVAPPIPIVIDGILQTTIAIAIDPAGAAFGLAQQAANPGLQHRHGHGSVTWYETMTRDLDATCAFYSELLGGTTDEAPGTEFAYRMLMSPEGYPVAGLMEMPPMVPTEVPSYWSVYFEVDDVDASTTAAVAAGATLLMGPVTLPAGRVSSLRDPEGAVIGLITSP